MPTRRLPSSLPRRLLGAWGFAALFALGSLHASPAGVAVLRTAPWSPNDVVREGAGEFEVMLCAARLQQAHRAAGIVGIGNRHGLFLHGAERALRFVALRGVPVAKLTSGGDYAGDPDGIFLDASSLSETEAAALLQRCLERHGGPPAAANPEQPTPRELAAVRAHLQPFREAFAHARAPRLAAK